jgi:hypothetical protein
MRSGGREETIFAAYEMSTMQMQADQRATFVPAGSSSNAPRPTFTGDLERGIEEAVQRFGTMSTPSRLSFEPHGVSLLFERGFLVGSIGGEPLGQILLSQNQINEVTLSEALRVQGNRPLGIVLTEAPFFVEHETIRRALERQTRNVLEKLLASPPTRYSFYRGAPAAPLHPRISAVKLREQATDVAMPVVAPETTDQSLPLHDAWRMGSIQTDAVLTPDEWALCRVLNGRRTLAQAIERFAGLENGIPRAHAAVRSLLERNLLEPSAVSGLRTIIVRRKREVGAAYHPPAGMVANLFLRQLDGQSDAYRVAMALKIDADKAASILASLYRDNVVDVIRGQLELNRLLEDY